jgi:excisionase family DNA binding protein
MTESWLTVEQAAAAVRISKSTLAHAMSRRQIGFTRLGCRCYFAPADLEAYLCSRRVESAPAGGR